MNTDVGSAYIEGLTGQTSAEWAHSIGQHNRAIFDTVLSEQIPESEDVTLVESIEGLPKALPRDYEVDCQKAAKIVVAMARGVLEKSPHELQKVGMEDRKSVV